MPKKIPQIDKFERFLISEYLRHGSIDKVFKIHSYDIPISFAGYHRVLDKHSIVKSAGPNSKLSESLYLLSLMGNYKVPLEKIYHKYAPSTIQVSTNTLHRMLHYTRLGLTRRTGVALIITPVGDSTSVLIANDLSLSDPSLGHAGDLSLPMAHSKENESPRDSIMRVMQQEMFSHEAEEGIFPYNLIPESPTPIMYINIADIKVAVYKLEVPSNTSFSSYKLTSFRFEPIKSIDNTKLRPGVADILKKYYHLRLKPAETTQVEFASSLNNAILAWAQTKRIPHNIDKGDLGGRI